MRIRSFDVYKTEFPFRSVFRHAKHSRRTSSSIFVRCILDDGTKGYGESLPREYVTGESSDIVFDVLSKKVLPQVIGYEFGTYSEVEAFCRGLYDWLGKSVPELPEYYGAICCALELALIDAFGRYFEHSLAEPDVKELRFSGVISSGTPLVVLPLAVRYRMAGVPAVKLKVGRQWDRFNVLLSRKILGQEVSLRVDVNGAWTVEQAVDMIPHLRRHDIHYVEQPLPPGDLAGMRKIHAMTGADIIVDEDLRSYADAERLIAAGACQGFNIRVSKCGGYFQSLRIADLALKNGLFVMVGCQVGETALLSTAGLMLARRLRNVKFLEGCFGTYLLREDILAETEGKHKDSLRFGRGGTPPDYSWQAGVGVDIDESIIEQYAAQSHRVERM